MKQLTLLFLLPLFFLLGFFSTATAQVLQSDYEALIAIYNAAGGNWDNWNINTNNVKTFSEQGGVGRSNC